MFGRIEPNDTIYPGCSFEPLCNIWRGSGTPFKYVAKVLRTYFCLSADLNLFHIFHLSIAILRNLRSLSIEKYERNEFIFYGNFV